MTHRPGVFLHVLLCFQSVTVSSDLWWLLLFRLLISDWYLFPLLHTFVTVLSTYLIHRINLKPWI